MRRRLLDALPDLFAVIAEGAWVAAVYAFIQAAAHGPTPLGPLPLAAFAGAGLVVARRIGPRLGPRWPRTALALVAAAAAVGVLVEPSALAALAALDPGDALRAHPGGVVAGLAFLRGFAYASPAGSEAVLEQLLEFGLPGLAVPVLLTGMLPEPWRGQGLAQELVACVVFLVAATVGVAFGRLAAIAGKTGFDWRRNRPWLALLGILAVGVVAVAVPASLALAPAIRVVLAALVAPILLFGAIAGLAQVRLSHVLSLGFLLACLAILALLATGHVAPSEDAGRPGFGGLNEATSPIVDAAGGLLLLLLVVVGILVLARLWMRESVPPASSGVVEERTIDRRPEVAEIVGPGGRRTRRVAWPAPVDAAGAYLALMHEIEGRATVRRAPGEPPAEHARRLRIDGHGAPGLDLLAADYELARFAGRRLTPGEERRGIARWGRLRRSLGVGTEDAPDAGRG